MKCGRRGPSGFGPVCAALALSACVPGSHDDPTAEAAWQVGNEIDAPVYDSYPAVHSEAMWFSGRNSDVAIWYEPSTQQTKYETSDEGLPLRSIWEHNDDVWSIRSSENGEAVLQTVDRTTNRELARIALGTSQLDPTVLLRGNQAWVSSPATGEVLVVDMDSRSVTSRIDVAIATERLEEHDTTIWAWDQQRVAVVIDHETHQPHARVQMPSLFGEAFELDGVYWSTYGEGDFISISAELGAAPTREIELEDDESLVHVDDAAFWLADRYGDRLRVLDVNSEEEQESFKLGFPATSVQVFGGSVFVTDADHGIVAVFDATSFEMTDYISFELSLGPGAFIDGPFRIGDDVWYYDAEDADLMLLTRIISD